MKYPGSIADIEGIEVGCAQDEAAGTGVTAVLARAGAVCGADVRGSAPGTRETALLGRAKLVDRVHGVLLAGGSAYGLDAAAGIMQFLEEQGAGFDTGAARVPIVPGAVLYDLAYKSAKIRPDKAMGYSACQNAGRSVPQGSCGAGCGATVGKAMGMEHCEKGGQGTASIRLPGGVLVGALVAVNAVGDVVEDGAIIAGARLGGTYADTALWLLRGGSAAAGFNTTIGVVATNAALDKDMAAKLAQAAQNGLALSISPSHTMLDGDTMFALGCGNLGADRNALIVACTQAVRRAVINAVLAAREEQ